jgi:hypothetical protein
MSLRHNPASTKPFTPDKNVAVSAEILMKDAADKEEADMPSWARMIYQRFDEIAAAAKQMSEETKQLVQNQWLSAESSWKQTQLEVAKELSAFRAQLPQLVDTAVSKKNVEAAAQLDQFKAELVGLRDELVGLKEAVAASARRASSSSHDDAAAPAWVEGQQRLKTFKIVEKRGHEGVLGHIPPHFQKVELVEVVKGFLDKELGLDIEMAHFDDVRLLKTAQGAPRKILFRVTTAVLASVISQKRASLAGKPFSIQDELSKEEMAIQNKLWPVAQEAKKKGKRVVWKREKLFVDKVEIKC